MIKLLGVLDIIGIVIILLGFFHIVNPLWIAIVAGYLLLKGWLFFIIGRDIASVIDFAAGIVVLILAFTSLPVIIFVVLLFWLIQKAAFSFI